MRPSDQHIIRENAEFLERVSAYEDQIADTNERLCAKEDELERERLLREELVRKAVSERMEQILAEAYEKAKAEAYAEVEAELADRMEASTQMGLDICRQQEKIRQEMDALEMQRAAVKAEQDRAEECLRQSREKLAAEVRDLKANTKRIKEDAIRITSSVADRRRTSFSTPS